MKCKISLILVCCFSVLCSGAWSQRVYSPNSLLSSGNWYKLSSKNEGIYRIDASFMNQLGITTPVSSTSVRLFGNGGRMIAEANNGAWLDDLVENPIMVFDGGDGQISGNDYLLFYAPGPDEWIKDSINQLFQHRKNIYNDRSYYFLSIGGTGKRIITVPVLNSPTVTINSFSERYFHELDTVNFLNGGKEWYGEELSDLPGRSLNRNFTVNFNNPQNNIPLLIRTNVAARSTGSASRFDLRVNNQLAGQIPINPVSGGQYDLFAQEATAQFPITPVQNNNSINYSFAPGGFNAQGWINWFEIFTRRMISLNGEDQLLFRDWLSVPNNRGEFIVASANANTQVWEITDPLNPHRMPGNFVTNEFRFVNDCSRLREYIAFNSNNFLIPEPAGIVLNQNLHSTSPADLIIISHLSLISQAERLAEFHRQKDNMRVKVVSTAQVYNEFGSGSMDPSALKDFVKMYWDKYGSGADRLKYLLLFGDATFDYKDRINNNSNLVAAYESNSSLDPLGSYTSDDFFGFLDNNEDINSTAILNLLDIGIGRIPARNIEEAKIFAGKIETYFDPKSLGPWRNNLSFIADDEDNNLHLQDAEIITATATTTNPIYNIQKIYLDAYYQETGAGGSQYPQASQSANNAVYNGTLIWNYNGHGGPARLAEETILDQETVNSWNNPNRLPLFITATCDFAPYDNPALNSIGENILLRPKTGAIALMTTTRPVFAFSNRIMNNNYIRFALQQDINGIYPRLGDAGKDSKNYTYQTLGDIPNNRKFTLLGDPAMRLGFPEWKVRITKVNGINAGQADTLSSTEKVTVEGEVTDQQNNLLNSFNGNVYPVVFDKMQMANTLGNDPGSFPTAFTTQSNILFKGKASVISGKFLFSFKVPKDINFLYGNGKISLYAEDSANDANGSFTNFLVGGSGIDLSGDNKGPEIKAYLNDEMFANGGITNQQPVLLLKLSDSSGINTAATGIDHDIVATLDNDNRQYFILNDFYQGDLDSYQRGTVRFQLPELEAGTHQLKIKAWDVLNNSGETILDFMVAKDEGLELKHVLNYPNPFTTHTSFWFEHNKPGLPLRVHIEVMTITGRVVKTFSRSVTSSGNRSDEIEWDGRDEQGAKLGRGVYLYKLRIIAPGFPKKELLQKLVIL